MSKIRLFCDIKHRKNRILKMMVLAVIFISSFGFAQTVQHYGFSQSSGTYTELENPTILAEATSTSGLWNNRYDVSIPFAFPFNGSDYTTLKAHSYGFVTFGTDAPYGYVPISSSNIGYEGYQGAIAPFAGSITAYNFSENDKGSISYKIEGEAPFRKLIIQWKNYSYFYYNNLPSSVPQNAYKLNFQAHLHENGQVNFVYDLSKTGTGTPSPSNFSIQIGMRGLTNSDYTNRYTIGSSETENLANTSSGSSNSSTSYAYANFLPLSGLTFTWTPPSVCVAPTAQPTDLNLTYSGIIINGTYTAANPQSDRYLILRHIQGENPNVPVDGTIYSVGQNTDLNAYVVHYGTNLTFENNYNNGAIRGNNEYIYTIYSVSSNCTGGPLYLLDNPLTETITNCPIAPSGITVGTTTENSFVLNWPVGENGNALSMNRVIEVATDSNFTNMVAGSPFTLSSSDLTLTVSGLNANTQYFYRAKNTTSLCESAFSSTGNMYTSCLSVSSFEENFDTAPTVNFSLQLPNCWSKITVGIESSTPTVNVTPTYHNSAPNGISFYGNGADMENLGNKAILVSPQLNNVGAGTHRLKFNAKMSSSGGTYDLQVVALSSNTADATIELIGTITASQLTPNYQEFSVNFNNYSGTANYVGIRRINGNTWSYLCVDDVVWEAIPSCPEVYGLATTGITNNSVVLSWDGVGTTYDIEYITNDLNFTETPTISNISNNYLIDGLLQPNTTYKFRVRQNCIANDDGFGVWSSILSFTTACDPFTTTFTEGFENVPTGNYASSTYPTCWKFIDGGSGSGYVDNISGNAKTGSKYFYITNSTDATGNYILVSPQTDNFGDQTYRVKFHAKSSTLGQSLIFGTLSDPSDASTFTAIENISLTTAYQEYSFNLTDSNSYFAFKHGLGATYRTIYIDDVVYEPQPVCPDVSGLSAGALSNSAVLSWNGLGTLYDIEYVENSQSFTGTPTVSGVQNNYLLEGLAPQTTYKFRVRQNCTANNDGVGIWSGVFTFTTSCEIISSFPFEEDFETTSNYIDCWSNQHVLGTSNWTYATGSTSTVTTAQSGSRNARFVSANGTASPITKLVSPIFNLSELSSPTLSFYYAQPNWSDDINTLKVYYRTSPSGDWVELAHYTEAKTAWTQEILELPNPSAMYQIAFEGINNYGRANVIDLVKIYEEVSSCLPVFEYGSDSNMITQVIFNTIDKTSPFTSGTTPEYEDFTDISTDVAQGTTHQISVKGPSGTFPSDVMVYIDFNQNGDFSDDGEGFYIGRIQPANPANALTITSDIVIPNDALLGTTKMRIVKNTNVNALSNPNAPNSISGPCADDLRAGQVEEYSVNIIFNCPQITTVPYLESFNEEELPECWTTSLVSGETNWRTFDGYFEVPLFEQGGARYVNKLYNNSNALLITPEINITDMPSDGVRVNVWIYRNNDNGHNGDVVKFHVNTVPNMDGATEILSIYAKKSIEPAVETSGWYNYTADIPQSYYGNTFYVIAQGITAGGFASNGIGFDEFLIEAIPTQQIVVENVEVSVENNAESTITTQEGTLQLIAIVNPENASQNVTWTIISGEEFATIDTNGVVTAIADGTVTIRATSVEDETKFDEIIITIAIEETNQEYCIPEVFLVNPISYVEFGTIQNPSSAEFDVPAGYEDFTNISTDVVKGNTYVLKVEGYTGGYEEYVEAYFDWNQNGEFEDSELYEVGILQPSMGNDGVFISSEIQIPSTALTGNTRMRIYKKYFTYLDACEETDFGQVEDYTINVLESIIVEIQSVIVSTQNDVDPEVTTQGGILQLVAIVNPENANQEVIWTIVSGEEFATIDESGLITAISNGTVTIRATSVEDTTKFDELQIIINVEEDIYCEVILEEGVEPISYVEFADLTKESSSELGEGDVYEDFTDLVANVTKGESYTLTVKGNTDGPVVNIVRAYIDWNQDGEFDAQTESYTVGYIQNSNGQDDVYAELTIEIPVDALTGNTRMRIVKDADDYNMSPCQMIFYGQAEDYTINISETTIILVENVIVSTHNDVDAEITTQDGILQLVALVNPTEVNQDVVWTIISGEEFATIDENGLVTAIANGTVIVRATSVEDDTKFDEIEILINITLSIKDTEALVFKVYPNPTNDIVNIETSEMIKNIILFDVTGKQILNQTLNQVNLSLFSSGIYFITVKFENGSNITEKIIKK